MRVIWASLVTPLRHRCAHLAGCLKLLTDPPDKLMRRADDEDVGTVHGRLEVRDRNDVVREPGPGQVP